MGTKNEAAPAAVSVPLPASHPGAPTSPLPAPVPNIYQRMRLVSEMVASLPKERYNQHHRYAFVGHEDVTAVLAPAFVKAGIVQIVDIEKCERLEDVAQVTLQIAWVNVDAPEDRVVVRAFGESQAGGRNKQDGRPLLQPQQIGVAISYAVKVAQLKCFCLATGDHVPDVEEQDGPRTAAPEVLGALRAELDAASTTAKLRDFAKKAQGMRAAIGEADYAALGGLLGQKMRALKALEEQA